MNFDKMEVLVPSEFYLSQNSPNPFKDMTKIKYCLPCKTKVILTLFNSTGEMIKELVNNQGLGKITHMQSDILANF